MQFVPTYPIVRRLWSLYIAREQLTDPVISSMLKGIARGAGLVELLFKALMQQGKLTHQVLRDYIASGGRVRDIIASIDIEHTADTVNFFAKASIEEGDLTIAEELMSLAKMLAFTIAPDTWDTLACRYAVNNQAEEALRILQEIQDRTPFGLRDVPSERTSNAVLMALQREERTREMIRFARRVNCAFYIPTLKIILPVLGMTDCFCYYCCCIDDLTFFFLFSLRGVRSCN